VVDKVDILAEIDTHFGMLNDQTWGVTLPASTSNTILKKMETMKVVMSSVGLSVGSRNHWNTIRGTNI